MLVSIVIPTFNSAKTIHDNIKSIKEQTYSNYQIVVIDNNSTDHTINIIKKFNFLNIKIITGKDKGIFDAINKGIQNSSGDLISVLHTDDLFENKDVLKKVVTSFKDKNTNIVYGNLVYVKKNNINLVLRYWRPGLFKGNLFLKGWNPPHPSFFVKKKLFDVYGFYKIEIGNCADIELMYRYLELNKISSYYLDETLVKMRYGGSSNKNIFNIFKQNIQILKFLKINNNIFKVIVFIIFKFFDRLKQFIFKKNMLNRN